MAEFLLILVVVLAAIWLAVRLFLRAPDHSRYDQPVVDNVGGRTGPSGEIARLHKRLDQMTTRLEGVKLRDRNPLLRQIMDEGLLGAPVAPDELGVSARPVDAGGIPAEWVQAPGADPDQRLLYIHGGGFFAGSPTSARMLTAGFSKRCGMAVLSVDYRLMPENRRLDSVADCQAAYRWMLDHGPDGPATANEIFIAGDSAGGNLSLVVSAWARDAGLRVPDGVIAFSPSTDSTLASGSYRDNIDTDPMLGPPLGGFARLPPTLKALLGWLLGRVNPASPQSSPLFGSLHGLPPTLVQASDCEMLVDDARRYVNKARSQGSPAVLQTWPGMVHVFQMFGHVVPEADEALDKAAEFIADPGAAARREE